MWYGLIIRKSYESGLKHVEEEIIILNSWIILISIKWVILNKELKIMNWLAIVTLKFDSPQFTLNLAFTFIKKNVFMYKNLQIHPFRYQICIVKNQIKLLHTDLLCRQEVTSPVPKPASRLCSNARGGRRAGHCHASKTAFRV